jgi:hypothetical protein
MAACAVCRVLFTPQQEQADWEKLLVDIQASGAA